MVGTPPPTFVSNKSIMKWNFYLLTLLLLLASLLLRAQSNVAEEKKCFVGSTLFMLYNLLPDDQPPHYVQLNVGYRFTPKDVIVFEAISWRYYGPLGRQYGPDYENPESDFPGKVQNFGAGLSYKRFLWKRAYAQIHATAFHQNYLDQEDNKIQSGFQLFNSVRAGYQFRLFKNRFFIEPSLAVTFWPINTNLPESFQIQEDRFDKYFLAEPGLQFGFNF